MLGGTTNKELMRKWSEALRSGKYKQGQYALRREDIVEGFCCLGVLADVHDSSKWTKEEIKFPGTDRVSHSYWKYEGDGSFIPEEIFPAGLQRQFANYNDVDGKSFEDIAVEVDKLAA